MNEARYDFHFAVEEMVPVGETFSYMKTHRTASAWPCRRTIPWPASRPTLPR
jgi:hypothetical protein